MTSPRARVAERVRNALDRHLRARGFARGKTTWWYRLAGPCVQLVHVRLARGSDLFCVHAAIRILNDTNATIGLNGPRSRTSDTEYLAFDESPASVRECARECTAFVDRVCMPWFAEWDTTAILRDPSGPFDESERDALLDALAGRAVPSRVRRSRRLVGAPVQSSTETPRQKATRSLI